MNRTDRLYALVEEPRAVAPRPRCAPLPPLAPSAGEALVISITLRSAGDSPFDGAARTTAQKVLASLPATVREHEQLSLAGIH